MNQTNIDLVISEILSGDTQKYELVVKRYQKQLLKYVYYLSNNQCDVEDTVQEIFIKVYRNLGKYSIGTSFNNWIYRITYNHTMNVLKKNSRFKLLYFSKLHDIPVTQTDNDLSDRTKYALSHLSVDERNLLYLRVYEELSYKEISMMFSIKESTLRKRVERIKSKFIDSYNKEVHHE